MWRPRHHDDQTMQAHCLARDVTNASVLSTTGYLQDAIDAHLADGYEVSDETVAHLSPARFEDMVDQAVTKRTLWKPRSEP